MQVVIFGSGGQLGRELSRLVWPPGWDIRPFERAEVDITDGQRVMDTVGSAKVVINAAAYTAVDKAESDAAQAFRVNRDGAENIAHACKRASAALLHVSTDYVFDGRKSAAYVEDDATCPLSVYGESKLAGELAVRSVCERHVIVRSSWIVSAFGHNFVKTILRLARDRDELRVVADQYGRPTPAADLAGLLNRLARRIAAESSVPWGTYHFAAAGRTSWHDLASSIVALQSAHTGRNPRVAPITTAEYPTPARRPANSELSTDKLERTLGVKPAHWQVGVEAILAELLAVAA